MLILKLLLTPALIGLVSLAGRRWGPAVSGWLVGLPLTSGPVALFLALDQGTVFAARAAQGTLLGLISVGGFCLAYCRLSLLLDWPWCMLLSWAAFFAITFVLEQVSLSLAVAFILVIATLIVVLLLLPKGQSEAVTVKPPSWETPLRMVAATGIVLLLTSAASFLGPQLSGLLTPFPVYATILGVFTHRFQGGTAARRLLRGVITGVFSFAAFFLIVAALITRWGIAASFATAAVVALAMHGGGLLLFGRKIAG